MRGLWVLLGEWESMSREQAVDNDTNEYGALYCGVFGGLAHGKTRGGWLPAKGFECRGTTPFLGLDGLEFSDRASWMGTGSIMKCPAGPAKNEPQPEP